MDETLKCIMICQDCHVICQVHTSNRFLLTIFPPSSLFSRKINRFWRSNKIALLFYSIVLFRFSRCCFRLSFYFIFSFNFSCSHCVWRKCIYIEVCAFIRQLKLRFPSLFDSLLQQIRFTFQQRELPLLSSTRKLIIRMNILVLKTR